MRNFLSPLSIFFLLAAAALLSYGILFLAQIPGGTILAHGWMVSAAPWLALSLLVFLILFLLWINASRITAQAYSLDPKLARQHNLLVYLPLVFLSLVPAVQTQYLTAEDLTQRISLLGVAVLGAYLYLNAVNLAYWEKKSPHLVRRNFDRFTALSLKKKLLWLFILSLVVYNLGSAVLLWGGITFSGDEPHFLLISQSLVRDGDVDLSNNYAAKTYREYMPPTTRLDPHIAPRTGGKYSFHSPGLPVLLLPFYALGSLFGGKLLLFVVRLGMSCFGALMGLEIFRFALHEWQREKLALGLWAVFSFTTPVFFYSLHLYPELLISLFTLYIVRRVRFSESISKLSLCFMGLLLGSFTWMHSVKYIFIAIPLFLYVLWELWRRFRLRGELAYFLVMPVVLTAMNMLYSGVFYGSLSFFSVSTKGATDAAETAAYLRTLLYEFPLRSRWETLAGYFFDQRDGLFFYAPIYAFSFLGMIEMLRRKRRDLGLLLFLTAPYVLFYAFTTQRSAYAPQARALTAVIWVMAVFLGHFLAVRGKRIFSRMYGAACGLSLILVYLLLRNPWALYQTTTAEQSERAGRLFASLSNLYLFLPDYLPSYLKRYDTHWLPNYIWLAVFALFLGFYAIRRKKRKDEVGESGLRRYLVYTLLGLSVYFVWIVLFPRVTLQYPTNAAFESGHKVTFYSLGRVARMTAPGRFRIPADRREYVFHFSSWRQFEGLGLEFGSPEGDYFVNVRLFDVEVFKGSVSGKIETLDLPEPVFYPYRKSCLYRISIYLERRSAVSITANPFHFAIKPR